MLHLTCLSMRCQKCSVMPDKNTSFKFLNIVLQVVINIIEVMTCKFSFPFAIIYQHTNFTYHVNPQIIIKVQNVTSYMSFNEVSKMFCHALFHLVISLSLSLSLLYKLMFYTYYIIIYLKTLINVSHFLFHLYLINVKLKKELLIIQCVTLFSHIMVQLITLHFTTMAQIVFKSKMAILSKKS